MSGGRLSGHVRESCRPSYRNWFLGFIIDTQAMEIRLPEEKLSRMSSWFCRGEGRKGALSVSSFLWSATCNMLVQLWNQAARSLGEWLICQNDRSIWTAISDWTLSFGRIFSGGQRFLTHGTVSPLFRCCADAPSMLSWFQMPQARGAVVRTWVTGGSLSRGRPVLLGQKCILVCRNCSLLLYLVQYGEWRWRVFWGVDFTKKCMGRNTFQDAFV